MSDEVFYNVTKVTAEGIELRSTKVKRYIKFAECAKNFCKETGKIKGKCVATRNIAELSFVFFSHPKTKVVFKKRFFKDMFASKSATRKFLDVQEKIIEAGYTSYDLS